MTHKHDEALTMVRILSDLLGYAHEALALEAEASWRLAAEEAQALTEFTGYSPPGSWSGVVALAAGTPLLEAERGCFTAAAESVDWSEEEAKEQMLRSFSEHLCPPSAAAGLFIMMGLHPAYGLAVAYRRHKPEREESLAGLDTQAVRWAEAVVAATVSSLLVGLENLSPGRHPIERFEAIISNACWNGCEMDLPEHIANHILLEVPNSPRVPSLTASELLDEVFIPARVMRRYDNGEFEIIWRPIHDK